ncbi:MAG: methyltransferase [Planctomycetota bacterium]|nr:MAG: methyltransferase [Planctomycetota bacterium]
MRELTLDKLPNKLLAKLDLETVFAASRCVIAAERFLVFRKLHGRELSAAAVGRRVGIHPKHCEAFLDFLVFLGLLKKRDNLYRNSALANRHFIQARSIDWTKFWSHECTQEYEALSVMEDTISSGRDWRQILGKERKPDYELVQEDPRWARGFTHALYDLHKPAAETLAKNLDLSDYQSLLDVGGGSGVMSIALARAHPHLRACILDFEFVCQAAKRIIRRERMSRRIKTLVGDMNRAIPIGFDVIMFWDIGHVDTRVMRMAYQSLPEGGMVVRDCAPRSKPKAPSPSAFLHEYLSVLPMGQTKPSILSSLKEAGFRSVKYRRIGRKIGLITGLKGKARKQMSRRN